MIIKALENGLIFGILALGVMISYKILDFADLSVDGTYPLGGVVFAVLITKNLPVPLILLTVFLSGAMAGAMTGILHVKFKITGLLSGILTMTALYSINLLISGFKPNISLYGYEINWLHTIVGCLVAVGVLKLLVDMILRTRFGYLLKLYGDNHPLIANLGHSKGVVLISGLALSNGIVALSGALMSAYTGLYDISSGNGMVVMGLSAVILGISIFGKLPFKMTTQVILGSILYRFIVAFALSQGLHPQLIKLVTVIVFLIAFGVQRLVSKMEGTTHA